MNQRLFLLSLCLAAQAAVLGAASKPAVLGAGGELYAVRSGAYGELFPGGGESDPQNQVLALDVSRPGSPARRLLVRGTQGDEVESSPSLFYENASQSVFVVWESRINPLHSVLYAVSFAGGEWSSVIPISGDRYSFKSAPRIAVTRDTFTLPDPGGQPVAHHRTVVHTVWWERAEAGDRAVYAPVVLFDGLYIGWNPVYPLDDFVTPTAEAAAAAEVSAPLLHAPSVQVGHEGNTVVVAFVDSHTGHLMTIDVDVMPGELAWMANLIRRRILAYHRIPTGQINAMADAIRAEIIDLGSSFHPSVRRYIADEIRAEIIDLGSHLPPGQIRRLADEIRAEIIDLGATVFGGHGFGRLPVLARPQIAEVGGTEENDPDSSAPSHLLAAHVAADLPAPATGASANSVYVSGDGESVLVSWEADGQIRYRESEAGGWTDVLSLALGPSLTREQAEQILQQRVSGR